MPDYEHVYAVEDEIAGAPFNLDSRRIGIVRRSDGTIDDAVADRFEMLVETFRESREPKERKRILGVLLQAHAAGTILFPISLTFGSSCLGELDVRRFMEAVVKTAPVFAELRGKIEADPRTAFANWKPRLRNRHSLAVWRILTVIRYASARSPTSIDDFTTDDFEAFVQVARPDGIWAKWLSLTALKAIHNAAVYVSKVRQDPYLGLTMVRRTTRIGRCPRIPDLVAALPNLGWLQLSYEAYLDQGQTLTKKGHRLGKRLLGEYFATLDGSTVANPEAAFSRRTVSGLLRFAKTWSTPQTRINAMAKVRDFGRWLENDSRDPDGLPTFKFYLYDEDVESFNRSVIVPAASSPGSDVRARPMPMRYHLALKEIVAGDDFAWPKSLKNKADGRPLHWITVRDPETERMRPEFCPVLARMLLLHLDLPLRNVQVRRLDSGEGDERRWDPHTATWSASAGSHAGYWARMGAFNRDRGVIREIASNGRTLTGLWVNSNKTQDRVALFDETSGYEIPWEHREVLENLDAMRTWQERFNPVEGPLRHSDLPDGVFDDDPSEEVRALIPDRFYLFRYPGTPGRAAPPSYKLCLQFFYDALEELERRLNAENPEAPVTIITGRDRTGAPNKAVFTLHGMRSATLTGLHVAGVPIEILSKVVAGHASILMTLKYLKFDPLHVSEILSEARLKVMADAKDQFVNFLRKATFERAVQMTACLSEDGLGQAKGGYAEPSAWGRLDIGLCPNGGTQCHVGGPAIHRRNSKGTDKSVYGPVPGGNRNCVRCRFFVTGMPFLIPLWSHGVAVLARADAAARQAAEREVEVRSLKGLRRTFSGRGETAPPDLRERIIVCEELMIADGERRDQALADLHAALAVIEKVRALPTVGAADLDGDGSVPMLLTSGEVPEIVGRESSRFELCDAVVQASRCFPSLQSAEVERERDAFLDKVLYRHGYVPITMAPFNAEERRRAADAMSAFLLVELGAREVDGLIAGRKTLADLGLQASLEDACRRAIGSAIPRLGGTPLSRRVDNILDLAVVGGVM